MKLRNLTIQGLKGAGGSIDFDGPLVMVEGDNGTGKSRIIDAIRFLWGADVAGASAHRGKGLVPATDGDLVVTAIFDDDGTEITIERRRVAKNADSLGDSIITINGQRATDDDLMKAIGTFAIADWLDLSTDRLNVELCRLVGDASIIDALEPAKRAALDAAANSRAAEIAFEAARKVAPAGITPGLIDRLTAEQEREAAAWAEWNAVLTDLVQREMSADAMIAKHGADEREMNAQLHALQARLPPAAAVLSDAERAEITKAIDEITAYCDDLKLALQDAGEMLTAARGEHGIAATLIQQARDNEAHLSGGTCPTCRQAVSEQLIAALRSAIDALNERAATAQANLDAAMLNDQQTRDALSAADADLREHVARLSADDRARETAKRRAEIQGQIERLQKDLHAHRGRVPPSSAQLAEQVRLHRASEPSRGSSERLKEAMAERTRYEAFQSALKAREASQVAAAKAKAARESIEAEIAAKRSEGFDVLRSAVDPFLPSGNTMAITPYGLGLTDGAKSWSGPGLSGGQRLMLRTAMQAADAALFGRRRFKFIEVDAAEQLSPTALGSLRDSLEIDAATGALDLAIVASCRREPRREGWQLIEMGPPDPFAPPPAPTTKPDDDTPAAATPAPTAPAVAPAAEAIPATSEATQPDLLLSEPTHASSAPPPVDKAWGAKVCPSCKGSTWSRSSGGKCPLCRGRGTISEDDAAPPAPAGDATPVSPSPAGDTTPAPTPPTPGRNARTSPQMTVEHPVWAELRLLTQPALLWLHWQIAGVPSGDRTTMIRALAPRLIADWVSGHARRLLDRAALATRPLDDDRPDDPAPPVATDPPLEPATEAAPAAEPPAPATPTPRVFESPPQPNHVANVYKKLSRGAREALMLDDRAEASDAEVSELHLAGFVTEDGADTEAGALCVGMVASNSMQPEPAPPPEGAGLSDKEARKIIRDMAPSVDALRAAAGVKPKTAREPALRALATMARDSGWDEAQLRAHVEIAMAEHPKRGYRKGDADDDGPDSDGPSEDAPTDGGDDDASRQDDDPSDSLPL